jgi:hypothetical protein
VPVARLSAITPRLAAAYSRKTAKTLARDVNALIQMGLVEKDGTGCRARKEIILGFLPQRAASPRKALDNPPPLAQPAKAAHRP